MEHRGSSFINSCVKVPVDPYSRQPTPLYERPIVDKITKRCGNYKNRRINFVSPSDNRELNENNMASSDESNLESFIDFIESIPDYGQVNHLSNEQFKQKLDYLKRKQRLLLKNLKNCLDQDKRDDEEDENEKIRIDNDKLLTSSTPDKFRKKKWNNPSDDLTLLGKKCHLEDSRTDSPLIFSCGNFASLAEDQDLLTYRCKEQDKAMKTLRNREIYSGTAKSWSTWSGSKTSDSDGSLGNSIETRSLPPNSPRRWNSALSKSYPVNSRDETEKYTSQELNSERFHDSNKESKESCKKRRIRPIPLTSRIPLYDKLIAAKEERSRMIREESAWCLMSQVKPFRLECDRRAIKNLTRSTPDLPIKSSKSPSKFKAKPVPTNLFGTEIYDRMLEDEYYRQLQKKIRAAELMKSSSLPPSMAQRERIKSAYVPRIRNCVNHDCQRSEESFRMTPLISERSKSAMTDVSLRGNNLAAILRCQASRERLERQVQKKLEEQAREHAIRVRESLTGRKPAWRALRHTTRKEHTRDLDYRISLRRDESREQAERHRLEMELMLNRVTQIPTLFERYSQSYQAMRQLQSSRFYNLERRKKKRKSKVTVSSSPSVADSRSDCGTLTNASKSSDSTRTHRSHIIPDSPMSKKKNERGALRVSINETAELIEDHMINDERSVITHSSDNDDAQIL